MKKLHEKALLSILCITLTCGTVKPALNALKQFAPFVAACTGVYYGMEMHRIPTLIQKLDTVSRSQINPALALALCLYSGYEFGYGKYPQMAGLSGFIFILEQLRKTLTVGDVLNSKILRVTECGARLSIRGLETTLTACITCIMLYVGVKKCHRLLTSAHKNRLGASLTPFTAQQETQCSICLGEDKQDQLVQLPCTHIFHKECIQRWLINGIAPANTQCPECRKLVATAQGTYLTGLLQALKQRFTAVPARTHALGITTMSAFPALYYALVMRRK